MANTGTLCISIIILIIVIILIVMVCYNYNQTQNTQTTQPYIQQPGLAAAAYRYKNNFAIGSNACIGKPNGTGCNVYGHGNSTCYEGFCVVPPGDFF